METPICDFVKAYAGADFLRLHMPGHKGQGRIERYDITEIAGADELYRAGGIIRESEENAARLWNSARTIYSTEGSSLAIRAMLALVLQYARSVGRRPLIAAGRNAHKVFLTTAALLDLPVEWLYPAKPGSLLSCCLSAEELQAALAALPEKPIAVYVTSPDYLGNCVDLAALSAVCRRHDILLLVDNAHGAYLNFLPESRHPLALGADLCCDSAHKTLPVLTGGAYLHIAEKAPAFFVEAAEEAMALFASTSPSYLILQSLDAANAALSGDYREKLAAFCRKIAETKEKIAAYGFELAGEEPLKITLAPKSYGYTGEELAAKLAEKEIVCEFADPDFLVMMLTPENGAAAPARLEDALLKWGRKEPISDLPPPIGRPVRGLSPHEALLAPSRVCAVEDALGKILASPSVGCPPAVPIAACGEKLSEKELALFQYYGIRTVRVVE